MFFCYLAHLRLWYSLIKQNGHGSYEYTNALICELCVSEVVRGETFTSTILLECEIGFSVEISSICLFSIPVLTREAM